MMNRPVSKKVEVVFKHYFYNISEETVLLRLRLLSKFAPESLQRFFYLETMPKSQTNEKQSSEVKKREVYCYSYLCSFMLVVKFFSLTTIIENHYTINERILHNSTMMN